MTQRDVQERQARAFFRVLETENRSILIDEVIACGKGEVTRGWILLNINRYQENGFISRVPVEGCSMRALVLTERGRALAKSLREKQKVA